MGEQSSIPSDANISYAENQDKKLRKALSTWDLLMLSVGGIIGSGWLFAAYAASVLSGPASILAWVLGGIIVIFIALVYAELGSMIPRSGAIVRYGHLSHGSFAGFLFGWAYFLSAVSVPAIEAEAVVTYAASYVTKPALIANGIMTGLGTLIAMILMIGFFFLNYAGVHIMGKTNQGLTWVKVIIPVITILVLIFVHFNPSEIIPSNGFMPYGWAPVFAAISSTGIVFSYFGFRQAIDYGGEARNPQRSIPIATIGSVLIGMLIYSLLQVVFVGGIDWSKVGLLPGQWQQLSSLASSSNAATAYPYAYDLMNAPFATVALSAGLVWLTYTLYASAYLAPSGTLNVYMGTSARTLYGMAVNGHLPKTFAKIEERNRIPLIPLITTLLVGFLFFLPFPSWYKMVGFISGATVFTYIVGGAALMNLRKQAPELKRPFRLPAADVFAPIAFILASEAVYWTGWPTTLYLAIGIFAGLVLYGILAALHKIEQSFNSTNVKAGLWVPFFIIVLTVLSYLGEYGGIDVIKFPLDLIVVAIVSALFYFWAIRSGIKTEEIAAMVANEDQYV
ncbi:amino acid transporter related protein [Thermoplasma acidophilum]|uniref:Amino acid transporter related protein n=1 Tax=Thermoplasma acidophilum (strain ATCC 25905 / DSM 1728 / JCM 9062 / NBRC 15155 / AMRC-C165) TaxID=273075 RepID=Q9HLT3_THEAC|nr:APC family permease [Thermoplasma acidophilum]MCY0851987.1 APC family permease [Thermoplasma acidophilum]CAC11289.1 amino acid transporter related protein [Thermoplasma acidophilum]